MGISNKQEQIEELYKSIDKTDSLLDSIETRLLFILALSFSLLSAYFIVILVNGLENHQPQIIILSLVMLTIIILLRSTNQKVKELAIQ